MRREEWLQVVLHGNILKQVGTIQEHFFFLKIYNNIRMFVSCITCHFLCSSVEITLKSGVTLKFEVYYIPSQTQLFVMYCSLPQIIVVHLFQDEVNQSVNIWFIFQKTKYVWDENKKQFCGLQFPVDLPFGEYMEWKGYQEDHEVTNADSKYGRNQYVLNSVLLLL